MVSETEAEINAMSRRIGKWMGYGPAPAKDRNGVALVGFWIMQDPSGKPFSPWMYDTEEECWAKTPRFFESPTGCASLREFLRQKGFLVELKAVPDGFPFRNNHEPSTVASSRPAWCKLYSMAPGVAWFRCFPLHSFGDTEEESVVRAAYALIYFYPAVQRRIAAESRFPVADAQRLEEHMRLLPLCTTVEVERFLQGDAVDHR
jgi:hypothetical protein